MNNEMSSYFEDPEFKESLARYEGMVENHTPAYFEADELTDIAEYYATKGRNEDADKAIIFALQLHPDDVDALIFRARSLMLQGKQEEARTVMGLIKNTTDREFKFLQADLLMEEEQMEEADKILQQLATDEEYELDTLLDIILDYIDINQEEYARKWMDCLFARFDIQGLAKTDQRLRDALCDYYCIFNNSDQAIPYLNITLDEYPYSIRHWKELGKCYLAQSQYEKANEAFDFALAIDENDMEALTFKAMMYAHIGNLQEAANYYLRVEAVAEKKGPIYIALASIYFDMRIYGMSMKYIQKLLKNKEKSNSLDLSKIYSLAALCQAALEHPDEGAMYMDQALELNSHDVDIRINAGHFFAITAGNLDFNKRERKNYINKAEHQFELALEFTPKEERMETLYKIGAKYFDERIFEYACKYFEQINREFPQNANSVYLFLIYGYYYLQKLGPFMHYLAKIQKELPEVYSSLGAVSDNTFMSDILFNDAIHSIKEEISKGNINLNKYL